MSDYKLEFTLRQHTPLIHFQHDQAGATLRATEVKPKLDKYIVDQMGGWKNIPKSWLVGNGKAEHEALNYKVRIIDQNAEIVIIEKDAKSVRVNDRSFDLVQFFANMGNEYMNRPRYISWCGNPFRIEIVTTEPLLKQTIENVFLPFLAKSNFGGRQNKGYGSFYIDNEEPILSDVPYLEIASRNWNDAILVINYYYQRLKSGINYCYFNKAKGRITHNEYEPSYLKIYLSSNGYSEWEKKWLKIKFLGLADDGKIRHFNRALLGLPYAFQFIPKKSDCNPSKSSQVYPYEKIEIDVAQPQDQRQIARIKSPITFKPVICGRTFKIFILVEKQDQGPLLGQLFEFKQKKSNKKETLALPLKALDIDDLILKYNASLGRHFVASNFIGEKIQVTLHP